MRIKKGDTALVISGAHKGKRGTVLRVLRDENRVVLEGINLRKRHLKEKKQTKQGGGIVERPMPLHISNVRPEDTPKGRRDKKTDAVPTKKLEKKS